MALLIPSRRPRGIRARVLGLVLALACASWARAETAAEYQIKAVFLFNFTQFVTWPAGAFAKPDAPLVIGIVGDDPFGAALDAAVEGGTSGTHPLRVRRFKGGEPMTDCQVLFISRSKSSALTRILESVRGQPVLTVGDMDDFANRGGMVRLLTVNNKIRLRINLGAARTAGLEISSKLLRPAEIVNDGSH